MSASYPDITPPAGLPGRAVPLPDRVNDPMRQRLAAAVMRLCADPSEPPAARSIYTLRSMQASVFEGFTEFAMGCLSVTAPLQPYGRVVQPPRTGKTVIAGHAVARTGLVTTFITNTKTLVEQAVADFREQLPDTPVGMFYGEREDVVPFGVNVTTYEMMRSRWLAGTLPAAIRNSALVFADEAHHAMTKYRIEYLRDAFDPLAMRIALTATPDYNAKRALVQFFPELIHELTLIEAVELDLLAPLRVWVAEVDADASTVELVAGEYNEQTLSRLMSEAPFFAAATVFRYDAQNIATPTLITCQTRQQAYDCLRYLEAHRPPDTSKPELVLGETDDRDRILRKFEKGGIDTLVSVRVLVEGWDSPRCKMLIDLAPCLSLVAATQKFCRVLTPYEAQEARIYMVLPRNLKHPPIMPMELLAPSVEAYETGSLVRRSHHAHAQPRLRRHPRVHPVEGVKLRSHIILEHRVQKPLLDPANRDQVLTVLASHYWFKPEKPCIFRRFRRLLFRHALFTGRADHLMRHLGLQPSQTGYDTLLARYCPEGAANRMLDDETLAEGSCEEDLQFLLQATMAGSPATRNERDKFEEAYATLGARDLECPSPDMIVYWRQRWRGVQHALSQLPPMYRRILGWYFLNGDDTQDLEEIADQVGLSRERVRQIIMRALDRIRNELSPSLASLALEIAWERGGRPRVEDASRAYDQALKTRQEDGLPKWIRAEAVLDAALSWS